MLSTIRVAQRVAARPERAFDAWLSADALSRWWWPHIPDATYRVDGGRGGRYDIRSEAAGIGVQGEFTMLERPDRIGMTWRWMSSGAPEAEEPVVVTFAPDGDGTLITVEHELTQPATDGDDIRQGWETVLGRLAQFLDAA